MISFWFGMKKFGNSENSEPQELRKYNVRQIAWNQGCIFCPQTLKLPQKRAERMLKILIFAPILCYFCQALVYF